MTGEQVKEELENPRNCYCGLWDTKPEFMTKEGNLPGFCGICGDCGAQGHTRHYPGDVPVTAAWCDSCYEKTARAYAMNPMRLLPLLFIAALIAIIAFFIARAFHWI